METKVGHFSPSATKLRQGNVFTPVCHSAHGGRVSASVHAWIHAPRKHTPQEHTPPRSTPPGSTSPLRNTPTPRSTPPWEAHPQEAPPLGSTPPGSTPSLGSIPSKKHTLPPPPTAEDGTHPTGMLSCNKINFPLLKTLKGKTTV